MSRRKILTYSPLRHGFTLVEVVFSIVLVSGLVIVALDTVGASVVARQTLGQRSVGLLLARDLMSEIMLQEYTEPDETAVFGPESSETGGSRLLFDDVDDYNGWNASPPQLKDGSEIANLDGWSRGVTVDYVKSKRLDTVTAADEGVKRVTVTATYAGAEVISMVAVRAEAVPSVKDRLDAQ